MGCGNCGTGANGKPSGCKGNGGCSTGGCNRLNVYDWLNALPLHDGAKPYPIIEVSFSQGSRKEFFRNTTPHILEKNDHITVEGVGGFDVGQVSLTGELVKLQLKKYGVRETDVSKRVLHPTTDEELELSKKQKEREAEVMTRARAIARSLNLDMKVCEVEIQADSKKGTFFYTADQRVDFRELIKLYAGDFRMKIEMRQIGARQESGKVGGIGSCGRELCCSTWLSDFKSVNTTAARYQNLSINQTKLSGQCGRLKCCLNYELDTYMDALSVFPDHAEHLETVKGVAHLQKRDIFKNLMWYSYSDNNKQYPLSITRVKEIQKLNKLGQKADELQPVELETRESKASMPVDAGYVNDVGQITLKALEKNKKKKPNNPNKNQQPRPETANADGKTLNAPRQQQNKGGGQPNKQKPPAQTPGEPGQPGQQRPPQQKNAGGNPNKNNQPKPNAENRPANARPNREPNPNRQGGQPANGEGPKPQNNRPQQRNPNQGQKQNNPPATEQGDNTAGEQTPRPPRPDRGPRPERGPRPDRPPRPERGPQNQRDGDGGSGQSAPPAAPTNDPS